LTLDRREFLTVTALAAPAAGAQSGLEPLGKPALLGQLRQETGPAPIAGASWFAAQAPGDGLAFSFPAGHLARFHSLTADFLLDGNTMVVWTLTLQEGEAGRRFRLTFSALNQCSFRMRMALSLVDQNRWQADREGAFLKPLCGGDRVDLAKVDRAILAVLRKADPPARFCMTPLAAAPAEVPRLEKPLLPKGPLVDELGQSRLHSWPGRTKSVEEMVSRVKGQLANAPKQNWPDTFSRWGGWKAKKLAQGTGFFGVKKDGGRWYLIDPDGYAFWSAGMDCVRVDCQGRIDGIEDALAWRPDPDSEYADAYGMREGGRANARFISYLAANLIRAFGREGWRDKWSAIALAELKRLRFNTVANWSEWEYAAKAKFPYVRPMSFRGRETPMIYRDFPDVFHAAFEGDAAAYASQLQSTASDPAFIGYFLMNEPTWGFSSELPAAGMLYTTDACATRDELARFLKDKHRTDAALAAAWNMPVSLEKVGRGRWQKEVLTREALADLRAFSVKMVERYFRVLSASCKKADPNHLNLGMRWAGIPPDWAVEGMKTFDVFSLNCYQDKLPRAQSDKIHSLLNMPVMVGEWHFGALDVGLPASGIGHLRNQADRARAYRVYLEDCAANPNCVGAHWFTLYDQSALGRYDGENYNIGFLDICHRTYDEMGQAAIGSHEAMYEIASGRQPPFAAAPVYLPKLFL
jgi:hypothetical protein